MKALHEAHIAAIEDVSTGSVSQVVWVMRQLGHEAEADDLTKKFLNRSTPVGTSSDYPFAEMVIDEKFRERWKEQSEKEAVDERDIETTIRSFYSEKSSTIDDIKRLSDFSADEYYDWFKSTDHTSVLSIAKALARIEYRLPTLVEETNPVEARVRLALERIAGEDRVNNVRLRSLIAPSARPVADPSMGVDPE